MKIRKCNDEHQPVFSHQRVGNKRGPSSFNMHNSELVFEKINLQKGDTLVDLGCGPGDYSIHAAQILGEQGKVFAVDIWSEMLVGLNDEAQSLNLNNITTIESNICQAINLNDNCADHCLIATVMHGQKVTNTCENLFPEIVRILKPGGQLIIIECKKEEMPFGPPLKMRISPEELEDGVTPYGFQKTDYVDLGYNYMMLFVVNK